MRTGAFDPSQASIVHQDLDDDSKYYPPPPKTNSQKQTIQKKIGKIYLSTLE
jgi:hypothetical protein